MSEKSAGTVKVCNAVTGKVEEVEKVVKSDEEWQRQLTPESAPWHH